MLVDISIALHGLASTATITWMTRHGADQTVQRYRTGVGCMILCRSKYAMYALLLQAEACS